MNHRRASVFSYFAFSKRPEMDFHFAEGFRPRFYRQALLWSPDQVNMFQVQRALVLAGFVKIIGHFPKLRRLGETQSHLASLLLSSGILVFDAVRTTGVKDWDLLGRGEGESFLLERIVGCAGQKNHEGEPHVLPTLPRQRWAHNL